MRIRNFYSGFTFSVLLLTGCGGGGSSGSTAIIENPENAKNNSEESFRIRFASAPLEPNTTNIRSGVSEHEFDVGHTLSISWQAHIYNADGSPAEGQFVYDGQVYISEDDTLDKKDKLLFSLECLAPSYASQDYACSQYASFDCKYNNDVTLNCLSFPLDHPRGLKDKVIDLSDRLNIIPKATNIIYKVCLKETEECDTAITPIILN